MASERPGKRACLDTFLFTSESVGEGHPGEPCTPEDVPQLRAFFFCLVLEAVV